LSILTFIPRIAASVLPVFFFLTALVFIDSYKLVRLRTILVSILTGAAVAAVCYVACSGLLEALNLELKPYSRYVAPLVEETLKAVFLVYLIRTSKVGFLVDAAIHGFAIGAGFGFIENIYYLQSVPEASLGTWIVRGFGTAIMHGGATAIFGMVSKSLYDRAAPGRLHLFLPGLGLAYALHSLFNHFVLPPLLSTASLIIVFPLVIVLVFHQSEQATREWLGVGFDTDQELLKLITSREFATTNVGRYLYALKTRFPGEVIADMLCLLRLHVELSIRAKGILMMREAGFRVAPDPEVKAKFEELRYLEKSIGTTGLLAIDPFLHTSSRDLWQLNLLDQT